MTLERETYCGRIIITAQCIKFVTRDNSHGLCRITAPHVDNSNYGRTINAPLLWLCQYFYWPCR